MLVNRLQDFVDHPLSQKIDFAALATVGVYLFPDLRATLHEWSVVATDIAPIAAVVWLAVQTVCKVIVTHHAMHKSTDDDEDDE